MIKIFYSGDSNLSQQFLGLNHFVASPQIPPRYLSDADRELDHVNPSFSLWQEQDKFLLVWLQLTLSSSILARVLGSTHSYQVWDKIHVYFHHQTRMKARQLRSALRHSTLDNCPVLEFLSRVKVLIDELAFVGNAATYREQMDSILEGLPQEFDSVIALIKSRIPQITIEEAEGYILVQELRLCKYTRLESSTNSFTPTVNLTRTRVTTRIHTQTPMLCIQISILQIRKVLVAIINAEEVVSTTVEDAVVVGVLFNVKYVSSIITQL